MKGHVRRRGKGWCVVYDEGRDESGRRQQRWKSGFATKAEADKALRQILNAVDDKLYARPDRVTVAQFARERYLPWLRGRRRETTVENYATMLERHVIPIIGGVPVQRLDGAQLDRLYQRLIDGDPAKERKPLAPATVRVTASVVGAMLEYARKTKLVVRKVSADAEAPKVERKPVATWSAREVGVFLDSVKDDRLYGLWRFFAVTGCRRGEGLGLSWMNLDLEGGMATIGQQVVKTKASGRTLGPPKTDSGFRQVPIDDETVAILKAHREAQLVERALYGTDYTDNDLVFCQPDGTMLDPQGISSMFQVRRRKAGLPYLKLHGLRHSSAMMGVDGDVHAELLRRRLGHSRIAVTVDLYLKGRADVAERKVANVVASQIDNREAS
jgi:integrase